LTDKKPYFKEQMLLITNELVDSVESAFEIYKAYLRQLKIESHLRSGVFKFLKEQLG
jgi:hypothetical protein